MLRGKYGQAVWIFNLNKSGRFTRSTYHPYAPVKAIQNLELELHDKKAICTLGVTETRKVSPLLPRAMAALKRTGTLMMLFFFRK